MAMTKTEQRIAKKAQELARTARIAAGHMEAQAALASGKCPTCGAGVRRNLSLTGWVQCDQFGAEGFRKDSSKPSCSWQGFTE